MRIPIGTISHAARNEHRRLSEVRALVAEVFRRTIMQRLTLEREFNLADFGRSETWFR